LIFKEATHDHLTNKNGDLINKNGDLTNKNVDFTILDVENPCYFLGNDLQMMVFPSMLVCPSGTNKKWSCMTNQNEDIMDCIPSGYLT
jgi:hypothetical protein